MTDKEIEAKLAAIVAASDFDVEYVTISPEQEIELGIERRTFVLNDLSDFQRIRDTHFRL
jgi:hypothetical protein